MAKRGGLLQLLRRLKFGIRQRSIRKRWRGLLRRDLRSRVRIWENLRTISQDEKRLIKSQFIKSQVIDALYISSRRRLQRTLLVFMTAIYMTTPVVLTVALESVRDWIRVTPRFGIYLFLGVGLVGLAELYIFILYSKLWPRRDMLDAARRLSFILAALFGIVVSVTSSCRDVSTSCEVIFFSNTVAGVMIVFMILGVSWIYICTILYQRRSFAQFPLQLLAAALFRAISRIEGAGSRWAQPENRSRILSDIDEAARVVRFHLFRRLKTTERYSQLWRDDRARLISNSLHEKQLWIMTPMVDTREELLKSLTQVLIAVLTGAWDQIDRLDDPRITREQKYRSSIDIAKTVLSGVLPIAIFVAARRYGVIEIASPVGDYIMGGLLLWGALSMVMAVDPRLTEKASAMREILSVIPGIGKKAEKN